MAEQYVYTVPMGVRFSPRGPELYRCGGMAYALA